MGDDNVHLDPNATPPPTPDPAWPIITTIENLKRSVSGRALLLLTTVPSQHRMLDDHRRLYRRLDDLHMEFLAEYGLSTRSSLPQWVVRGER